MEGGVWEILDIDRYGGKEYVNISDCHLHLPKFQGSAWNSLDTCYVNITVSDSRLCRAQY